MTLEKSVITEELKSVLEQLSGGETASVFVYSKEGTEAKEIAEYCGAQGVKVVREGRRYVQAEVTSEQAYGLADTGFVGYIGQELRFLGSKKGE